jgi:hypothetical protein
MSANEMTAPLDASSLAVARPIPEAAPVIAIYVNNHESSPTRVSGTHDFACEGCHYVSLS